MQSIEQISAAVVAAMPQATPQDQGKVIAAIIEQIAAPAIVSPAASRVKKAVKDNTPAAKPAKRTRKAAKPQPKPQTAKNARKDGNVSLADRLAAMSTESGSITSGQIRRITSVSEEHGFEVLDMSDWSMRVAGQYYADLVAAI